MRNTMLRIASVLLVAVMLTTALVGGVFAKYITNVDEYSDSAIVADWGVAISFNNDADVFANAYDDSVIAKAETTYDLVAPGTASKKAVALTITGTPEVDYKVEKTATVTLTGWIVDAADYCPIVFTVKAGSAEAVDYKIDGVNITSVAELEDAVEAAITASNNANINANTTLNTVHDVTVSWAWAFEGNDDVKDTKLGDAAASSDTAPSISISIDATVTQLD